VAHLGVRALGQREAPDQTHRAGGVGRNPQRAEIALGDAVQAIEARYGFTFALWRGAHGQNYGSLLMN
jgi:hypothetical protein